MRRRRKTSLMTQLLRYGVVGGIAFLVDYGTLYALTEFAGLHHLVSAALAFTAGLLVNYTLSILWVFRGERSWKPAAEFTAFAAIGIVGAGLNEGIIWLGTDVAGLHYLLSKLISTAIVFFWNFFARKLLIFSRRK